MSRWYYEKDRQQHGPIGWAELESLVVSGEVSATDLLLEEGSTSWLPALEVAGLAIAFPTAAIPSAAAGVALDQPAHSVPETVDDVSSAVSVVVDALATRATSVSPQPVTSTDPSWPQIPGYQVLGKLGEGGMGTVYKARHLQLNRVVALKMIREKRGGNTGHFEDFQAEAEAVAAFQHPNIVQIHEIGAHEGQPYFTLEFMDGGSLHEKLKGVPQQPRDAALLVEIIARAMHYAHQRRIIHRDLKPLNVLLASLDSSAGSLFGVPKVADFGLAKLLPDEADQVETQMIRGTPPYMAPEQASHETKLIGPATDVYALGAILYEMLTGRPPFQGKDPLDTLDLVRTQEPVPPSQTQPKTPRDLETICLKCLQKEPGKRYGSAQELADDVRRFLNDEPIVARPAGRMERGWRWCRRNPLVAAWSGGAVATLVLGFIATSALAAWALREANTAIQQETLTKEQMLRAERASSNHVISLAQREIQDNNFARALEVLADCSPDHRRWEFYYLQAVGQQRMRVWSGHSAVVTAVAYSADRKHLASSSGDKSIKIWRLDGQPVRTLEGHTQHVHHLAYSKDGNLIGSASFDGTVRVWDAVTGKELQQFKCRSRATSVAFSPDSRRLAAGTRDQTALVWSVSNGQELFTLKGHRGGVESVAFSPDGRYLASASNDETVKIWNADSGEEIGTLAGHDAWVASVAFSPDSEKLISGGGDGKVIVWNVATRQPMHTLNGHSAEITCVVFSQDGERLSSASADQTVKVWSAADGLELITLKGHDGTASGVAFSPDGKELASAGHDRSIRIWDLDVERQLAIGQETHSFEGHTAPVGQVAFSPAGEQLASASLDKSARVWNVIQGKQEFALDGHHAAVMSVRFSPNGQLLATAAADGVLKLWSAKTGAEVLSFRGHDLPACSIAFSPDGQHLASGSSDKSIRVWSVSNGTCVHRLEGHTGAVLSVSFSPNGAWLASGSEDASVRIWNLSRAGEAIVLEGHTQPVWSVAFSPDGERLASGSLDRLVKVWDATNRHELHTLRGHTAQVSGIAFHPDGQRLASTADDRTVKVWDVNDGREVMTFAGYAQPFLGIAFSPDGRRLAAGCADQTLRVWDAPDFRLIDVAATAGREVLAPYFVVLLFMSLSLLVLLGVGLAVVMRKRATATTSAGGLK